MLTNHQLDSQEHSSIDILFKIGIFSFKECIWKCCLQDSCHFVQAYKCSKPSIAGCTECNWNTKYSNRQICLRKLPDISRLWLLIDWLPLFGAFMSNVVDSSTESDRKAAICQAAGMGKTTTKRGFNSLTPGKSEHFTYRKIFNIRHTKSQHLNVSRLVLQLSLPNPLKPGVMSRMKM